MDNNDICKLNAINNSTGEVESIELLGGGAINRITEIEDNIDNINNIFKDFLIVKHQTDIIPNGTIHNTFTAQKVDGYSLLCCTGVQTNGWVGSPYCFNNGNYAFDIWDNDYPNTVTSDMYYSVDMLYIKNL